LKFEDFNFEEKVLEGIRAMNYEAPTPIQEKAIPLIMAGKDIIASAQTGTGKTAAYLLPIIQKIITKKQKSINTLIIAPTRELAIQIDQQLEGLAYYSNVSSMAVYGGGEASAWDKQKNALKENADIIIATPGRIITHLNFGYINLDKLEHFILDEADRMLDMGFHEDIVKIMSYMPQKRQNLMFSATMPSKIKELADKILVQPEEIKLAVSKPPEKVLQAAYMVYFKQKIPLIKELLEEKKLESILIFSSTKKNVRAVCADLIDNGFQAKSIHSDLDQSRREETLRQFRSKKYPILVATDILSRGIDIDSIDLVINYDVPRDAEDYVHRIGRTARAESTGVAITFISERDQNEFSNIEKLLDCQIYKIPLPTSLGEGPVYNPGKRSRTKKNKIGKHSHSSNSKFKKKGARNFSKRNNTK
jgi:superfamily II DNA/RNA helicase